MFCLGYHPLGLERATNEHEPKQPTLGNLQQICRDLELVKDVEIVHRQHLQISFTKREPHFLAVNCTISSIHEEWVTSEDITEPAYAFLASQTC